MARSVIWIRFVHPFVQMFSWNLLFSFFRKLKMALGAHVVFCMAEPDFLKKKKKFTPKMGEKDQALVYNKSLYYCNSCMFQQLSYLGKFQFLRYDPKCSWPTILQDFSINRWALKLAVSYKEINEINWFLVCPFNSFLRNGLLVFPDFWHNSR